MSLIVCLDSDNLYGVVELRDSFPSVSREGVGFSIDMPFPWSRGQMIDWMREDE